MWDLVPLKTPPSISRRVEDPTVDFRSNQNWLAKLLIQQKDMQLYQRFGKGHTNVNSFCLIVSLILQFLLKYGFSDSSQHMMVNQL